MTVIKVENISKQYRLGNVGLGSLSHDINRWYHTTVRGREDPYLKIGETNDRSQNGLSEYVWALKDINFEVKQGEVLGIIGRNGAGKSTLLKILSRTTTPTTGQIKIKGRVASLLEVGTGFHPELTGRENIFLNGAILGMTKREIKSKFDEIVDFAGVERYIDTPVKRYSSGMYVRLAFGVAAHLEPEILIVDEVLAVGDAEFQKKALGKMKDVSTMGGRTVLFVSHNMASINTLCKRGILLKDGEIIKMGKIDSVLEAYNDSLEINSSKHFKGKGVIKYAELFSKNNYIKVGEDLILKVSFKYSQNIQNLILGFVIKDKTGNPIIGVNNKHYTSKKLNEQPVSEGVVEVLIPAINFLPGTYTVDLFLGDTTKDLESIENAITFLVEEYLVNPTSVTLNYNLNKFFLKELQWELKNIF